MTLFVHDAYAEEKRFKNAEKAVKIMRQAGVDSPLLEDTAYFIDDRVEDDKFDIYRGKYEGYNLSFSHEISSPDYEDLEIRIAPENSNYEMRINHERIMVTYSRKIEW